MRLWAMSSGGAFGAGLGLGDPEIMPAAHTDLILAVLGEEWGWIGFAGVYLLYAALIWLGLRIAMRASDDYSFFLALGLTLLIAFSTLLISGGVLDLSPLSGVVTPFLSYGGTAMIANFAIFGVLLSFSRNEHTRITRNLFAFRFAGLRRCLGFSLLPWSRRLRGFRLSAPTRRQAQALSRCKPMVSGVIFITRVSWRSHVRSREAQSTIAMASRSPPATSNC